MSVWFAFFGRDFLAGTLGWSAEERGHYVTLLVAQWEQDGLPNDLKRLELISPGVKSCWATLEPKFPLSRGGKRRNLRLEHERHKAHERSERARQSASKRWSAGAVDGQDPDADPPEKEAGACDRICDGICDGICPADASMSMSYSPPPPTPPPEALEGWKRLREAWNEAWGEKRQWRSAQPFPEALARLEEPGWLEEAIGAIPAIKTGACSGFKTPPTLRQFCGADEKGVTFVAKLLGGEFTDEIIKRRRETTP
jgi:hypothetical protein